MIQPEMPPELQETLAFDFDPRCKQSLRKCALAPFLISAFWGSA
jgi:hypothetical protein